MDDDVPRRRLLSVIGVGTIGALAGCGGSGDGDTTDAPGTNEATSTQTAATDSGTTQPPGTQTRTTTDSGPGFDPEASIEITTPFSDKQYINWDDQTPEASVEYVLTANLPGSVRLALNDDQRVEDQFDTDPGESREEEYTHSIALTTGDHRIKATFHAADAPRAIDQIPVRVYRPDETFEHPGIDQESHDFDVLPMDTVTVPVTISPEEIPGDSTPDIHHSIVYGTTTGAQETIATHTEPGEHTVDVAIPHVEDLLGNDTELFSAYFRTTATVDGEPVAQTQTELAFDTSLPAFENLYENAGRHNNPNSLEKELVEEELEGRTTSTERVAHLASLAAWKSRAANVDRIRGEIERFQEEGIINADAYVDTRIAYSGAEVLIREGYVEEDDGTVKKFIFGGVPSGADRNDLSECYLIAGREPVDMGPTTDENLHLMWDENATATTLPLDFRALINVYERSDVDEDDIDWQGINEGVDNYLLDGVDVSVDFTREAGLEMAAREDIDLNSHSQAFEDWKTANESASKIRDEKYLLIDLDGDEMIYETVNRDEIEERGFIYSHL